MSLEHKPMSIKILNVDNFIFRNDLPRIKSMKILSTNKTLADDGLFSQSIFGNLGSKDRMNKMAYIELNCRCLQPYICIALERMSADFSKTISGAQKWKIKNNKLEKSDDQDADTGLDFIYQNFDLFIKTLFPDNGSKTRKQNLNLLKKYKKDDLFVQRWIIIPAGLRDVNTMDIETQGKSEYDQINDFYKGMINISNQLESMSEIDASIIDAKFSFQMQNHINNIYRLLIEKKMAKKSGILQKSAMSKTISYSSGNVICNSKMTRAKHNDDDSTNIRFGYIGIHASLLVDIFYPFVLHRMKQFMENHDNLKYILVDLLEMSDKSTNDEIIEKCINTFKHDTYFMKKRLESKSGKYAIKINGKEHVLNMMEFFKNDIIDTIIHDKFVTGTRFPVDNKNSMQYLKPVCTTTESVYKVKDDLGIEYELCKNDIIILAYQPNTHSLKSWGGDFDGDTIAVTGIFSDESNQIIEKDGWLRNNPLSVSNQSLCTAGNELLYGLYCLTNSEGFKSSK